MITTSHLQEDVVITSIKKVWTDSPQKSAKTVFIELQDYDK